MDFHKIINVLVETLATAGEKVPKLSTKKYIEVHDQLANATDRYKLSKNIRFKYLFHNQTYVITVIHISS